MHILPNYVKFARGTLEEYGSIAHDPDTLYFIEDACRIYLNDKMLATGVSVQSVSGDPATDDVVIGLTSAVDGRGLVIKTGKASDIESLQALLATKLDKHGEGVVGDSGLALGTNVHSGSKGFRIISYSGTIGGSGTYTLAGGTSELVSKISASDKYSILMKGNFDYWGEVTSVSLTQVTGEYVIQLDVTNFFTNERGLQSGDTTSYDASKTYHSQGQLTYAPEMGYSIQNPTSIPVYLYLVSKPDVGTEVVAEGGTAIGEDVFAQGKDSFGAGYNIWLAKYASALGKNLKAGYGSFAAGRNIDLAFAQACAAFGDNLTVDSFASVCSLFGRWLVSHYSNQHIFGMFNENKEEDLIELGWGTSQVHKNLWEVDKSGSHKMYQTAYKNAGKAILTDLNKPISAQCFERFDGNAQSLPAISSNTITAAHSWDVVGNEFGGYITSNIEVNKPYLVVIDITIQNYAPNSIGISGLKYLSATNANKFISAQPRIETLVSDIQENVPYKIAYVYTPTEAGRLGFGFHYFNQNQALKLTVNSLTLYPLAYSQNQKFIDARILNITTTPKYVPDLFDEVGRSNYLLTTSKYLYGEPSLGTSFSLAYDSRTSIESGSISGLQEPINNDSAVRKQDLDNVADQVILLDDGSLKITKNGVSRLYNPNQVTVECHYGMYSIAGSSEHTYTLNSGDIIPYEHLLPYGFTHYKHFGETVERALTSMDNVYPVFEKDGYGREVIKAYPLSSNYTNLAFSHTMYNTEVSGFNATATNQFNGEYLTVKGNYCGIRIDFPSTIFDNNIAVSFDAKYDDSSDTSIGQLMTNVNTQSSTGAAKFNPIDNTWTLVSYRYTTPENGLSFVVIYLQDTNKAINIKNLRIYTY